MVSVEMIFFLREFSEEIRRINENNGWDIVKEEDWSDNLKIPTGLMLMVTEIAEAMEAFRKNDLMNFYEELADVIIRIFDMVGGLPSSNYVSPVDELVFAIIGKMEKNRLRSHKHGGKRV